MTNRVLQQKVTGGQMQQGHALTTIHLLPVRNSVGNVVRPEWMMFLRSYPNKPRFRRLETPDRRLPV